MSRSEIDLYNIRKEFRKNFGTSLYDMIKVVECFFKLWVDILKNDQVYKMWMGEPNSCIKLRVLVIGLMFGAVFPEVEIMASK